MEDIGIGKLITFPRERDAIHIAVAPVEALYSFRPGQLVHINNDGKAEYSTNWQHAHGIVDPFLTQQVQIGDKFWLFLFPGSIKSIRHDWYHPAFQLEVFSSLKMEAKLYLEDFARKNNTDLEDIIRAAEEGWTSNGEGINVPDEFWIQYKMYTGKEGLKQSYFSCSC